MYSSKSVGIFSQYSEVLTTVLDDPTKCISQSMNCISRSRLKSTHQKEASFQSVFRNLSAAVERVWKESDVARISPSEWRSFAEKVKAYASLRKANIPSEFLSRIQAHLGVSEEDLQKKEILADPRGFVNALIHRETSISAKEVRLLLHISLDLLPLDLLKSLQGKLLGMGDDPTARELLVKISDIEKQLEYERARKAITDPEELASFIMAHEKWMHVGDLEFLRKVLTSFAVDFYFIQQFIKYSLTRAVIHCLRERFGRFGFELKQVGEATEAVDWEKYHAQLTPEEFALSQQFQQEARLSSRAHEGLSMQESILEDTGTKRIALGWLTYLFFIGIYTGKVCQRESQVRGISDIERTFYSKNFSPHSIVAEAREQFLDKRSLPGMTAESAQRAWSAVYDQIVRRGVIFCQKKVPSYESIYGFLAKKNGSKPLKAFRKIDFFENNLIPLGDLINVQRLSAPTEEEVKRRIDSLLDTFCDGFPNLLKERFFRGNCEIVDAAFFTALLNEIYYNNPLTYEQAASVYRQAPLEVDVVKEPRPAGKKTSSAGSLLRAFRELSLEDVSEPSTCSPDLQTTLAPEDPLFAEETLVSEDEGEWTLVSSCGRGKRDGCSRFLSETKLHSRVESLFRPEAMLLAYPHLGEEALRKLELFKTYPGIVTYFCMRYGLQDVWESPTQGTLDPHVVCFGEIELQEEGVKYQGFYTDCFQRKAPHKLYHHVFTEIDFRQLLQVQGDLGRIVVGRPLETCEDDMVPIVLPQAAFNGHDFYDCDPDRFEVQKTQKVVTISDKKKKRSYRVVIQRRKLRGVKDTPLFQGLLSKMKERS